MIGGARIMSNETVLTVDNLNIYLPNQSYSPNQVVHQVNFALSSGKVFGLLGGSGSGKTLTCHSIMNLLQDGIHASGSIQLKGKKMLNLPEKEMRKIRGFEIAMITQNPMSSFNPVITIGEHMIETVRTHKKVSPKEAKELAISYLEKMDFSSPVHLLKQFPFQLSGGMLQRVMIAIALLLRPSIIIADEPTTALDKVTQHHILKQLEKIKNEGNTSILLVSHDLNVISRLADEVAVMYDGRLVEKGSLLKVFNQPSHPYTKALINASTRLKRGIK